MFGKIGKNTLTCTAAALWLAVPSFGVDLRVDKEDPACSDVTASPYCTIGAAVADAQFLDRVIIAEGTYQEALSVTEDIFIEGAGAGLTFIDGGASPTLDIRANAIVEKLTITGTENRGVWSRAFIVRIRDCEITGNSGPGGGGIYQSAGSLELTRTVVHGNTSNSSVNVAGGGGIWSEVGELFLIDSAVIDNHNLHPESTGGGVALRGISGSFTRSTIANNTSQNNDGGISALGVSLTLVDSVVYGNMAAGTRGGVGGLGSEMTIRNSTISGNQALFASGLSAGGGGRLELRNVTIANNHSTSDSGRALSVSTDSMMSNTIVAGNTNNLGGTGADCVGTILSEGYNLIQSLGSCLITGDITGNLTGVDPRLRPLSSYGGATLSHALAVGSPALDAGHPAAPGSLEEACPLTDQRGVVRPQDGIGDGQARCDIGAHEGEAAIFADGFESGNLDRWSASMP